MSCHAYLYVFKCFYSVWGQSNSTLGGDDGDLAAADRELVLHTADGQPLLDPWHRM